MASIDPQPRSGANLDLESYAYEVNRRLVALRLEVPTGVADDVQQHVLAERDALHAVLADTQREVDRLRTENDEFRDKLDSSREVAAGAIRDRETLIAERDLYLDAIRRLGERCVWVRTTGLRCRPGICPDCDLRALLDFGEVT